MSLRLEGSLLIGRAHVFEERSGEEKFTDMCVDLDHVKISLIRPWGVGNREMTKVQDETGYFVFDTPFETFIRVYMEWKQRKVLEL